MKILIKTQEIVKGLEPLKMVVSDKTLQPILECVKIVSEDGLIYFTGDNGEVNCESTVFPDKEVEPFSFCVQFQLFFKLINGLSKQEVSIEIKKGEIFVTHKNGDFKLPTFASDEFPTPRTEKMDGSGKVKGDEFRDSLNIANKFTLNSEMEPMSNISIVIDKGVVVRSTNRATLFKETLSGKGDQANILISGKASSILAALIGDKKAKLSYSDNLVEIKSASLKVTAIQQTGDFPIKMFDQIADSGTDSATIHMDPDSLSSSLKRLGTIADSKTSKAVFTFSEGKLLITCDNKNQSTKAHETIEADSEVRGDIGYDLRLLVEILSVMGSEITFSLSSNNLLYLENGDRIGIVAPMKIEDN